MISLSSSCYCSYSSLLTASSRGRQLLFVVVSTLLLSVVVVILVPRTVHAVSSTSSLTSTLAKRSPPDFVKHVSRMQLDNAFDIAKRKHNDAIQQAMKHYPIVYSNNNNDKNDVDQEEYTSSSSHKQEEEEEEGSSNSCNDDENDIDLNRYNVANAPGSLLDYDDILPHSIYVTSTETPLLTNDECNRVIQMAEDFFVTTNNGVWTKQKSGQYDVAGFWIRDIPTVHQWFIQIVKTRLFPLLVKTFPEFCYYNSTNENENNTLRDAITSLCVDNAYLFKYTAETGRRTDVHTDSGCLSFTIALNGPTTSETTTTNTKTTTTTTSSTPTFTGGGTWFEGLNLDQEEQKEESSHENNNENKNNNQKKYGDVIQMEQGQITIRPGSLKHCGYAVTSGTRYIIGGFCMHRKRIEYVRQLLSAAAETGNDGITTDARQQQGHHQQQEQQDNNNLDTKALLEAAIVLNPTCDVAYNQLANHYDKMLNNPDMAITILEYCMKYVHPSSCTAAFTLGTLYMKKIKSIQEQQQQQDKQKQHSQFLKRAKECFEICLLVDNSDIDAMMGMSQIANAINDVDMETVYLEKITNIPDILTDPQVIASAHCNLGVLCATKISQLEQQASSSSSSSSSSSRSNIHQDIQNLGQKEINHYLESIKYVSNRFASWYSLACSYASQKQYNNAIQTFQKAILIAKKNNNDNRKINSRNDDASNDNDKNFLMALQGLYRCTVYMVQQEQQKYSNQEAMIQRIQDIMGADNYHSLQTIMIKTRQQQR